MTQQAPQLSSFQRQVLKMCKLNRAICVLIGGLEHEDRDALEAEISAIPTLMKSDLQELLRTRTESVDKLRQLLGFLANDDTYIEIVDEALNHPADLLFAPKQFINEKLFKHYDKVSARWADHALHTRFGFDARGKLPLTGKEIEWRLLDAALFEDMASLWNEAHAAEGKAQGRTKADRINVKRSRALKTSCARAVFALLEAYINGIGTAILWTTDEASLTKDQLELLTERSDDGKPRFKRFKEKIQQYPRIATAASAPPIQEGDADFSLVLKRERDWRDAIMHPTPKLEENRTISREHAYFD